MSIFNKLFKSHKSIRNQNSQPVDFAKTVLEIAKIISFNNTDVISEITSCLNNTKEYLKTHRERFEESYIYTPDNFDFAVWNSLTDILIRNNYAFEFDWKSEADEFLFFFNKLKGNERSGLSADDSEASDNELMYDIIPRLQERWKHENHVIGCIDIDSDSYVIFVVGTSDFEKLRLLASSIEHRIDFAGRY